MHFCQDELFALVAGIPFLGYAVVHVRGWVSRARTAWRTYRDRPVVAACCRRGHPGEP